MRSIGEMQRDEGQGRINNVAAFFVDRIFAGILRKVSERANLRADS